MLQVIGMDAEVGKIYSSENCLSVWQTLRAVVRARKHHRVLDVMVAGVGGCAMLSHVGGGKWEWK
jgi:hypothetical protein